MCLPQVQTEDLHEALRPCWITSALFGPCFQDVFQYGCIVLLGSAAGGSGWEGMHVRLVSLRFAGVGAVYKILSLVA